MNEIEAVGKREKCLDCFFSIFYKKFSLSHINKQTKRNWNLKKQEDLAYVDRKKIFG